MGNRAANGSMQPFLRSTDVIDWLHPDVSACARRLRGDSNDPLVIVRRCFEWVRDEIKHTADYQLKPVTCAASEVLHEGSGYCYAKSHLLAAVVRANGIPAGLCYQRLSLDGHGAPFCLHGLNAVHLAGIGWYRIDPRGNKPGIEAQFVPPAEQLAFRVNTPGEADWSDVWADPHPVVVTALRAHSDADRLARALPDIAV